MVKRRVLVLLIIVMLVAVLGHQLDGVAPLGDGGQGSVLLKEDEMQKGIDGSFPLVDGTPPLNELKGKKGKEEDPLLSRPFTVLLLGVDDRKGDFVGRSDVIMLAVVRPQDPSITLVSIPRDTYAPIIGRGTYEKINHAFAYGTQTALSTIEHFTGIPIDYYVAINFKGFIQLIDLLGGLFLDVEREVSYQHRYDGNQNLHLKPGKQLLSGEEALLYVRFRSDAEGDFGRNRRQQQVIKALIDQAADQSNITKLADAMKIIVEHVRTNMSVWEMVRLARQLAHLSSAHVESLSLKGDVGHIDGISYVFIGEEDRLRLKEQLRSLLK